MKRSNALLVFLVCLLGMPLAASVLPGLHALTPEVALLTGALLGAFHVVLRPVLRLVTMPLGCITLGLFGFAIDVGLLYACDHFIDGFFIDSLLSAVLTALFINALCALFRK